MPSMYWTVPTLLTWARVLAIPLVVAVFYMPALQPAEQNLWATALFVVIALTDWADGYLARRLKQTSAFGAFFDPVADKFLVCASMLILLDLERVHVVVALIIVGREIAISALREWMATIGAGGVAVHGIGKLKTAAQMVAIPFLLYHAQWLGWIDTVRWGTWLIEFSAALTVVSMVFYLARAWPQLARVNKQGRIE
jgi:cardiolipin synthase